MNTRYEYADFGDEEGYVDADDALVDTEREPWPGDGHFVKDEVLWAMRRIEGLLKPLGLRLHGFSPGVSALDEMGRFVRFDEGAWRWLEHVLVDYAEMREFVDDAKEFVRALEFGDAPTQLNVVERCRLEAREAAAELSKLRHRLASALTVRGDPKERSVARLLRDVAQWHRASGDTALADDEAAAIDLVADQLGGLAEDAALDIDQPPWDQA